MKKSHRVTTVALLTASLAVGATGCSATDGIDGLLGGFSTATYDDRAAMVASDRDVPAWVPTDASEITSRISTRDGAADAVIQLDSPSPLDEALCREVERRSAPSWTFEASPSAYDADEVWACGDWSVIPSGDGWFGWTPNSSEERADATGE